MGLISITGITDGTVIDASDVNTPLNTIVNELNGNLNYLNLADNAVTTDKITDASVTLAKLASDSVNTSRVVDSAVTTPKMKPNTINYAYTGSNTVTSSTSFVDSGGSTTYTSGSTPERLFIWFHGMIICNGTAAVRTTLSINGADQADEAGYNNVTTVWQRFSKLYIYDIAANTTIAIKGRVMSEAAGQNVTFHNGSPYNSVIRGFAIGNA